jgi:clan AA aspartic protease (TIGR02281 family)
MRSIYIIIALLLSFNGISQIEIKANKQNGVYLIPCKVNGVPLEFIFDTGATNVSISITEAKFLVKNGLLNEDDIKETIRYQIANGSVKEGTKINLEEIEIEGYIIRNVTAQIVYEQNAPLLLGLSALNKIGKVVLENEVLKIYPKSKIFSKEKIFENTKSILNEALTFQDATTNISTVFKENFLGIHTIVNLEEPDYDYYEPTNEEYEKKSKDYAFLQAKLIIQNNQVYLKRIASSGIELIAFMYDYSLAGNQKKMIYAVSSKMLIDLGNNPTQEKFEEILIKQ